jgi:hypothetical protein
MSITANGMRRKIAIVAAPLHEPQILDEPIGIVALLAVAFLAVNLIAILLSFRFGSRQLARIPSSGGS